VKTPTTATITNEPIALLVVASGERADKFVALALEARGLEVSRARIQRWCEEGLVTRSNQALKSSSLLRAGDELVVRPVADEPSDLIPDPSVVIDVVYEDDDLVVVHKPAHLVVHPAKSHREKTLIHGLLARGGFDKGTLEDCTRPGIVHRIDKGTSGLLVVAKKVATREKLKELFQQHRIDREYVALVVGTAQAATYDTAHGRHETDRLRFTSLRPTGTPRRAITHVAVIEQLHGLTLVRCTLETGRTHQIRVHLSERSGTPILGDPVYGARPKDPAIRALGEQLGRQALHAQVLGFVHPRTRKKLRFERPPPADFEHALKVARERAATTEAISLRTTNARNKTQR
jgi:23S rRNA pseudouridine1911/1915/1917 synthase